MSPATEVEVMPDANAELAVITQKYELAPKTAADLRAEFAPLFKEASELVRESHDIVVTDASQKLKIQQAALCRKALKTNRLAAEKLKDSLKRDSLRYSNAVQGLYNYHLLVVSAEEERLEKQEKFVAIKEAERKAALKLAREQALQPFGIDCTFYQLGEMNDQAWGQLLENTQAAHEAKLAAERKAQEDRIREENARLREDARIREENARLQREAKEREEAARLEREQAALQKAEWEAHAKREAEKAEAAAKAEREREQELRRVLENQREQEREAAERVLLAERARLEAIAAEERRKAVKAAEEAADKAKAERDAAIEANRQERLRLQALAEVERQKQETARKAAEAQAAVERAAREKLEVEAAMRAREEAMRKAKEAEVARKAALAPDRDKLLGVAQVLRTLDVPKVTSDAAKDVVVELLPRLTKLAAWIETECKLL